MINELTGEIMESTTSLVAKEVNELANIDEFMEQMAQMEMLQEKMDTWKFQHKEQIKEICKKYNLKTISNEYITISYVDEHKSRKVDTKKMKDYGIYEDFTTEVNVKDSIRIARKK